MSQNDPTDSALAAIASIMDESHAAPSMDNVQAESAPAEASVQETAVTAPPPPEAAGYSKAGPGPLAALRFRWTVREQNGIYYVDETIGENSKPLVSGPMERDAAIRFVDDREAAARERFEALKHEMIGRSAIAGLVRDGGEM